MEDPRYQGNPDMFASLYDAWKTMYIKNMYGN